jgi:hypothetical protein
VLRRQPLFEVTGDPLADLILQGEAEAAHQAEERYLDRNIDEVVRLVESSLSDEELREHPLLEVGGTSCTTNLKARESVR